MPKEKRDIVDMGFDYFLKVLKDRKDNQRKRDKLKNILGISDDDVKPTNIENHSVVI